MTASQEGIVGSFFNFITLWYYDKAIDFMNKQGKGVLLDIWPESLSHILCDFALAEKNYSEKNFEPVRNKTERKENKSYLDFVYRAFYQDLEKLQPNVTNGSYVSRLIASLLQFISIRLKLLEVYNKLYEIGSTNNFIDFNELSEVMDIIYFECCIPLPVEGMVQIIQYELECLKHLIDCHEHMDNWNFFGSVVSSSEANESFLEWFDSIENKEALKNQTLELVLYSHHTHVPALMLWFLRLRRLTLFKCTLYFHGLLSKMDSEEVMDHCTQNELIIVPRFELLQKKSEAQYVLLAYDTSNIPNFKGPTYFCPDRVVEGPYLKYPIMTCFPELDSKADEKNLQSLLSKFMSSKSEEDVSMSDYIDLITYENENTLLSIQVDLKVYLFMFYDSKPKNEDKDKANVLEFVSLLRCHKLFTAIYRF